MFWSELSWDYCLRRLDWARDSARRDSKQIGDRVLLGERKNRKQTRQGAFGSKKIGDREQTPSGNAGKRALSAAGGPATMAAGGVGIYISIISPFPGAPTSPRYFMARFMVGFI